MPFAVFCLDRPEPSELRAKAWPYHLDYVNPPRLKGQIGGTLLYDAADIRRMNVVYPEAGPGTLDGRLKHEHRIRGR